MHEINGGSLTIRDSVYSLCRDGVDAQYTQYLSKCHKFKHGYAKIVFKHSAFLFEIFCDETHTVAQKQCERQLSTKVCGSIFVTPFTLCCTPLHVKNAGMDIAL